MSNGSVNHRPEDDGRNRWSIVDYIDHPDVLETMTLSDIRAEFDRLGFAEDIRGSVALNWSWKKERNGDPSSALIFTRDGHVVHLRMAPNGAYAINEIIPYADYISEAEAMVLFTHLRFGATHLSEATRKFLWELYERHGVHIHLKTTRKVLESMLAPSQE